MSALDDLIASDHAATASGSYPSLEQVIAQDAASQQPAPQLSGNFADNVERAFGNTWAGALKGASNIGATLLSPVDALAKAAGLTNQYPALFPADRRAAVTQGLQDLGADPNSLPFKTGEIGSEIAGTAGVGGLLGKGIESIPALASALPKIAPALTSGGFNLGQAGGNTIGNALTRLGAGAATGGVSAGLINPQDAGTGALIGGAMPAAVKAAGAIGSGIADVAKPLIAPRAVASQGLQGLLGDRAPEVLQKLQARNEIVPGSVPTAAQAAGTPELVAIEKVLANNPEYKPLFDARIAANNAARWNAINSVAGDPGALDAAMAARNSTAQDLYGQAFSGYNPDNVTPWVKGQITQLMKRPAMQSAMKQAQTLAQNEGLQLNDQNSIQGLHYAKMAIDDQISNATRTGDNNLVRSLMDTKGRLLTVMNKLSPDYESAMNTYAEMSKPINTMQAGQSIQQGLMNGAVDAEGRPIINLSNYRTQFGKAMRGADYGITPDAAAALQNVGADLQRATISNSVRQPGSDTVYNLQAPGWLGRHLYGDNFSGPTGTGRILGAVLGGGLTGHPIIGAGAGYELASRLGKFAGRRVNDQVVQGLLNPQEMASLLTYQPKAMPGLLAPNATTQALMRTAPLAISASP